MSGLLRLRTLDCGTPYWSGSYFFCSVISSSARCCIVGGFVIGGVLVASAITLHQATEYAFRSCAKDCPRVRPAHRHLCEPKRRASGNLVRRSLVRFCVGGVLVLVTNPAAAALSYRQQSYRQHRSVTLGLMRCAITTPLREQGRREAHRGASDQG